jgi:hypothetical protein
METNRQLKTPQANTSFKTHDHVRFGNVEMNQIIPMDEESYKNSEEDLAGQKFSKNRAIHARYLFLLFMIIGDFEYLSFSPN